MVYLLSVRISKCVTLFVRAVSIAWIAAINENPYAHFCFTKKSSILLSIQLVDSFVLRVNVR